MPAGLAVALGVIIKQKHAQQRSNSINSTASYADAHTCPNFLDAGQATLQQDRKPSSSQPNLFEELSVAELAAVMYPSSASPHAPVKPALQPDSSFGQPFKDPATAHQHCLCQGRRIFLHSASTKRASMSCMPDNISRIRPQSCVPLY